MSGKGKSKLNQSSKSTSSKKSRNKRDIISTPPHSEFPATTSTFSGLAILFSIFLGFLGINNTYASSISISLSGNVSLNLLKDNANPVFGTSTTATANVKSDHYTGYTLTIQGANDSGKLENGDGSKYISSINTAINENTFKTDDTYNNQWGFLPSKYNSVDNSYYQPSPLHTNSTTIDVTNSPTSNNGNNYTLALGAKVTPNMALDSYGQTFVLAATGNGYDYHIGFSDVMETLPDDMYGNTQLDTVTLPATTPIKAGYTFAGWCDAKPTVSINGTTCPVGAHTYPAGYNNFQLNGDSANNVELYAIWEAVTFDKAFSDAGASKVGNYYRMQDMTASICNAVAIGQEGTLVDNRTGNKTYTVGKLKDDRCWMLDNLALGGNSAIALTPDNTNITANWTLPASVTSLPALTEAGINTTYINTIPSDSMSTAGGWKVGVYYNYCAASAGSYCPAGGATGTAPSQDICPKGWRMPSGGTGGEYQTLYDTYVDYTVFRLALHLPLSGRYVGSQVSDQGNTGNWWSRTLRDGGLMYNLDAYASNIYLLGYNPRGYGFPLRCLAKSTY